MSMFMAAMRQELRETGRIKGFGGMSSASWAQEVREYEAKLADQRGQYNFETEKDRDPNR